MKNVLIVNIGNSNLRHSSLPRNPRLPESNYREATRVLLEQYDVESANIQVGLIPEWLNHLGLDAGTIYIYGSNNPNAADLNKQDTLYAARIVEWKLKEGYPFFDIKTKETPLRAVDADGLMQFFRKELLELLCAHPDSHFYLLDAGGTPQQKSALKLNLEYLLPSNRFNVYNAERDEFNQTRIVPLPSLEYRRMIDQIQARSLVRQYNYSGALTLLDRKEAVNSNQHLIQTVRLAETLFSNHPENGKECYDDLYEILKPKVAFLDFLNPMFSLQLILEIARVYYKQQNWSLALLYYHIFYERVLNFIITKHLKEMSREDLISNIEDTAGWPPFIQAISDKSIFPNADLPTGANEWRHLSLKVKYALVKSLEDDFSISFLKALSKNKLDKLSKRRNKVAHEGRHLKWEHVKPNVEGFKTWHSLIGLKEEELWFDKLNNNIEELLLI